MNTSWWYSACGSHWWIKDVRALVAAHRGRAAHRAAVLLDVGCNKGYFSASALNYMAPPHNFIDYFYQAALRNPKYDRPCGTCNDCKQPPEKPDAMSWPKQVEVHCFEPSDVHVAHLTEVQRLAPWSNGANRSTASAPDHGGGAQVQFNVHQAAVSDAVGVAHFPKDCALNNCSLSTTGATTTVKTTTIDTFARESLVHGAPIDVLKIDTEGNDPLALAGAFQTLKEHRVRAVFFEYVFHWRPDHTLQQCVEYLDDLGYVCFFDGPELAQLTGCWDPKLEQRQWWANVVCAVRGSRLAAVLRKQSLVARL